MKKATSLRIFGGLSGLLILLWMSKNVLDHGIQERRSGGFEPVVKVEASSLQKSASLVTEGNSPSTDSNAPSNFERFDQLTREVIDQLPQKESLRGLGFDKIHYTPTTVLEAGRALGLVAEAWHQSPELKKPAGEFYRDCALDARLTDSVRILCLSNWSVLASELDSLESPQDNSQVPGRLLKLALYMTTLGS
jgi:hypothetical protein